jgi:serine protease
MHTQCAPPPPVPAVPRQPSTRRLSRPTCLRRTRSLSAAALLWGTLLTSAVGAPTSERGPSIRTAATVTTAATTPESARPSVARVIVKYRSDSTLRRALSATNSSATGEGSLPQPLHARTLSNRLALELQDGRVLGRHMQALRGVGIGLDSAALAAQLRTLPEVEWAVVDERRRAQALPNDPFVAGNLVGTTPVAGQWYLRAPTDTLVSAIDAEGAWNRSKGSAQVTVAVLDTGVRFDHPDLAGKLHPGYDFVNDGPTAADGNGRDTDPSDPGDGTAAGECAAGDPPYDSSWHGTQVAGLIGAATNNNLGMAGVGWNTMVLPVRVLGRCGGFDSDIIAGMRWAAGLSSEVGTGGNSVLVPNPHKAQVLNMSLGSSGSCPLSYAETVRDINAAGVTVVVAAGNSTGLAVDVPANCAGALAVAGVRHAGSKVGYSNIGLEVALAAPAGNCVNLNGECLYPLMTTTNLGAAGPGANGYSDGRNITVGTSFAAPLVAGTAALMLAVNPELSPATIRALLQQSARAFPTTSPDPEVKACRAPDAQEQLECLCTTTTCGAGLLNAAGAVGLVPSPPAPSTPPISGGGGGGHTPWAWTLGLLLASAALRVERRRSRRRGS